MIQWYTDYPWEKAFGRLIAREQVTSLLSPIRPAASPVSGAGRCAFFIAPRDDPGRACPDTGAGKSETHG